MKEYFRDSQLVIMKRFKQHIYTVILLSTLSISLNGQELLSVEYKGNLSLSTIQLLTNLFGIQVAPKYGIDSYKITYTTLGSDMNLDTASGLMILPDVLNKSYPIVSYAHGTTDGRSDVPSNLEGGYELGGLFASLGMIVSAPDFIGMGESRGAHPYVHGPTEARASIDMLFAVKQYLSENEISFTEQLFTLGYSQGGHATMATHRMIQEEYGDELEVTASLPMSGPYFMSTIMRDLGLKEEEYFYPEYMVYTILGVKAVYPSVYNTLEEVFIADFIEDIRVFEATGDDLDILNLSLLDKLEMDFGGSVPRYMFHDSIVERMINDETYEFNLYLKESDVYEWIPNAPVLILYCPDDDQVPFENAVKADSVMNALGASNVEAMDVSGGLILDHVNCIAPALNVGVPWILGFVEPNSTDEIELLASELAVFPNPAIDNVVIRSEREMGHLRLVTISGQIVHSSTVASSVYTLDVSGLKTGIYILQIEYDGLLVPKRVIVQR